MRTTVADVEHILRKELLVPVGHLRLDQELALSAGLSSFEWNVLLYHLEEKYGVQFNAITSSATVQDVIARVQSNQK